MPHPLRPKPVQRDQVGNPRTRSRLGQGATEMARTKQTAKMSTGGKAPRKQLASKAARGMSAEHLMELRPVLVNDIIQVWKEPGARKSAFSYRAELFHEYERRKVHNLKAFEFKYVFGKQFHTTVDAGEWEKLTLERAMRKGLTESEQDDRDYGKATQFAWTIANI